MKFTFDKLTIGDAFDLMSAVQANDLHRFAVVADRYTVGGLLNLPVALYPTAIKECADAYVAHMNALLTEPTTPDVLRVLRQALGDADG